MSKDSEEWNTVSRTYRVRIAIRGSLREILIKFTACGWLVVQMDPDGWTTPRYGVGGIMSVSLQVQRTIKRAEIRALYMVLLKLCWPAEMFSDHRRVVRAFNKGEVNCITASHKDAELWVQVWRKIKVDLCVVQAGGLGS